MIGYARVSIRGQLLDRQLTALAMAGCLRIFADEQSGRNAEREELRRAHDRDRSSRLRLSPTRRLGNTRGLPGRERTPFRVRLEA
ncbi:recombinase family protein [Nonomuraea sp. NPDC049655]|uniref:recombinase family protein n=1 Tax=Nonomuraea sp. NPDC049655 TaxID=3364355 RepID=UPI0037B6ECC9